jgi:aminoglycoside phosphotransferase (APT) family kinase protein
MFFAPPLAGRTILSIEADSGSASLAAAGRDAEHVCCLHPDREIAEAIAHHAAATGLGDFTVVTFSPVGRLPFLNGVFDIVAVHGMDVVASRTEHLWRDWRASMGELVRVSKCPGFLYIGGSSGGLRRVLQGSAKASFSVARTALGMWRMGMKPKRVLRRWDANGRSYRIGGVLHRESFFRDLRSLTGAALHGGEFAIVAGRLQGTLLDQILDEVAGAGAARRASFHIGSGGAFRVETRGRIVRLPFSEVGARRCRNGFAALEGVQQLALSFATPRPLLHAEVERHEFFVETRIRGSEIPYLSLSRDRIRSVAVQAADMLTELHRKSVRRTVVTAPLFRSLFQEPLDLAAASDPAGTLAAHLREAASLLRERFLHQPIALVRTHGDFKITNVVQGRSGRAVGLVDWDLSEESGLPATDLVTYLAFDRALITGEALEEATVRTMGAAAAGDPLASRYRVEFDIDPVAWSSLGLLALIHYLGHQVGWTRGVQIHWKPSHRVALANACRLLLGRTVS